MRRLLTISGLVLLVLLASGPALATHFEWVIFSADCTEWNADIMVRIFRFVDRVDMTYEIAIEDLDGNVLLGSSDLVTIIDDDGDHWGQVLLGEAWDEVTEEIIPLYGTFRIHATFTLIATDDNPVLTPVYEQYVTAECAVVPNADVSWGAAKSTYR